MSAPDQPAAQQTSRRPLWQHLLPWLITIACFAFLLSSTKQ